jgi:hypothetical protein
MNRRNFSEYYEQKELFLIMGCRDRRASVPTYSKRVFSSKRVYVPLCFFLRNNKPLILFSWIREDPLIISEDPSLGFMMMGNL